MATAQLKAVLQVGDTSTPTDSVDLADNVNCAVVGFDEGTLQEPLGPNPEETQYAYLGRRTLKLELIVMDTSGQSFVTAEATIRSIEHKLTQAQRSLGAGGQWIGTPVTLRLRALDDSAPYVYADVAGGTLTQHWKEKGAHPVIYCTLLLQCLPYFHGDLVTTGTLAISSGFQFTQAGLGAIPGDRSAVCTLYWGDTSSSGHTNRIRVGRRSFPGMAYDAFTSVCDLKPDGGTDTADATAANGHYVRITATPSAQKIASVGLPDKFNNWETGDFTGMSAHAATGVGSLSEVIAGAALVGGFGFHAKVGAAAGTAYAEYQMGHPTQASYGETWINVRNTLTTGSGRYMELDHSVHGSIMQLRYSGGAWQINVLNRNTTQTATNLSTPIAASTWTKVRLVYDQLPSNAPRASCYLSTDGRIWTLAAQYDDLTSGTVFVPDQFWLACANDAGAILPEAWYDQFQCGDWNPLRAQSHGKIDVWCRTRTSASLLGVSSLAGTVSYAAGALQAGNYTIVVTALDASGNETSGSTPISASLGATGECLLSWTDMGAPTNHRVYVADLLAGTLRWSWVATGSAGSTYTLSSALPLPNFGTAPATGAVALGTAYLRGDAAIAAPGGTPHYVLGTPQPLVIGSNNWETVFLGTFDLPPAPRGEQNAASSNVFPDLPWELSLSGFTGGTGSPTIDVDAIWCFPHDEPQASAIFSALNNASNVWWEIDTRRDGRVSGVLREEGDLLPSGQVRVDGRFTLGVGNNVITVLIDQAAGVNSWTGPSANFYFTYRPRYVHLPQSVS